jgi:hypothetical protein
VAKGISLESVLTFELTHSPDTLCRADDDDEAHAAIEWDTQKFQFGENCFAIWHMLLASSLTSKYFT